MALEVTENLKITFKLSLLTATKKINSSNNMLITLNNISQEAKHLINSISTTT